MKNVFILNTKIVCINQLFNSIFSFYLVCIPEWLSIGDDDLQKPTKTNVTQLLPNPDSIIDILHNSIQRLLNLKSK